MGKNLLRLDTSGFEEYIAKLEKLEADVKPIVTEALNKAGVKITSDTTNAVAEPNLPRGGKYFTGYALPSRITRPKL